MNIETTIRDLPYSPVSGVSDLLAAVSAKNPENILDRSCKGTKLGSGALGETWPISSPKVEDRMCGVQCFPSVQNPPFQLAACDGFLLKQKSSFTVSQSQSNATQLPNILSAYSESRSQMIDTFPCLESKNDDACQVS